MADPGRRVDNDLVRLCLGAADTNYKNETREKMLEIKNLHAGVEDIVILKGLDLSIKPGEVHAIMGPNGSGKSTLASVLAGRDGYEATEGEVVYAGKDLLDMAPEERAREGVFLAFQYPVEIPGVNSTYFLKSALNEVRKHRGESELDAVDFLDFVKAKMELLELPENFMKRPVNDGFSGGEKKRNEVMQMALLEPEIAILDETDSGLDIDALRVVAAGIREVRADRPEMGVILITHYQRLLDEVRPDHVHVMMDGRIIASGGMEIAESLEAGGYDSFRQAG